jgi:uncharacterized BrkB/YihY/UPF0761 family membrane protein
VDAARIRSSVESARATGQQGLETASQRWRGVAFAAECGRRFARTNGSVLAGHLTFRLFLVMVPATLVAVSALGYASASGTNLEASTESNLTFTKAMADVIASTGDQAKDSRLQAGLIGLFALTFAGVSLVKALRLVFTSIWQLPEKAKGSLAATMGSVLALFAILLVTMAINRRLSREGLLPTGLGVLVLIIAGSVAMLLLSLQLPRRPGRVVDLVPGAVVAGLGFAALNGGAAWYFTRKLESTAQVYGALGVTMTMLTYLFLWSELLVLAAVVDTVWLDQVVGDQPGARAVAPVIGAAAMSGAAGNEPVSGDGAEAAAAAPAPAPAPAAEPEPATGDAAPSPEPEAEDLAPAAGTGPRHPRGLLVRRVVTVPLAIITACFILASAVAVWAHDVMLDSDRWQETVVPLLQDPEVRAAVGETLGDQILAAVDVEDRARTLLPDRAQILAPALTGAVETFVRDRIQEGLASEDVQRLWAEINARVHPKIVAFLRGDEVAGISAENGVVTLNLLPLMAVVLTRIDQRAPGMVTRGRPVPAIDASVPEDQARAQLSEALGVALPAGFGVITLPRSDRLAQLQRAVEVADRAVIVLPVLSVLLVIVLFVVAPNRRRALVWLGVGVFGLAAVIAAGLRVAQDEMLGGIQPAPRQKAAIAAAAEVLSGLRATAITLFVIGLVLALGAALLGERPRRRMAEGYASARVRLDGRSALVTSVVAVSVALLAVVWLMVGSPTPLTFLLALALMVVAALIVARRQIADAVTTLDLTVPAGVTGRSVTAGLAGLRGPNAEAGLRGPNAEAGLRGPNAEAGLRGPNAEAGLRGPNAEAGLRGPNAEAGRPLPPPPSSVGGGGTEAGSDDQ